MHENVSLRERKGYEETLRTRTCTVVDLPCPLDDLQLFTTTRVQRLLVAQGLPAMAKGANHKEGTVLYV